MVHYYGSLPFETRIVIACGFLAFFTILLAVVWIFKALRPSAKIFTPMLISVISLGSFVLLREIAPECGWSEKTQLILTLSAIASMAALIAFIIHAKRKYT